MWHGQSPSSFSPYTTLFRSVAPASAAPMQKPVPYQVKDRQFEGMIVYDDSVKTRRPETGGLSPDTARARSEEHTSELQSLRHLVCRLLLEKKKHIHYLPCLR